MLSPSTFQVPRRSGAAEAAMVAPRTKQPAAGPTQNANRRGQHIPCPPLRLSCTGSLAPVRAGEHAPAPTAPSRNQMVAIQPNVARTSQENQGSPRARGGGDCDTPWAATQLVAPKRARPSVLSRRQSRRPPWRPGCRSRSGPGNALVSPVAGTGSGSEVLAVAPPVHQQPGQAEAQPGQRERGDLQEQGRLQVLLLHLQVQEDDAQAGCQA